MWTDIFGYQQLGCGEGVLLAFSGYRPGCCYTSCTEQGSPDLPSSHLQQRLVWPKMSMVLRLRNLFGYTCFHTCFLVLPKTLVKKFIPKELNDLYVSSLCDTIYFPQHLNSTMHKFTFKKIHELSFKLEPRF